MRECEICYKPADHFGSQNDGCDRCHGCYAHYECADQVCVICAGRELKYPIRMFEEKLGPTKDWVGNCYSVACGLLKHFPELAKGAVTRYGMFTGDVDRRSFFNDRYQSLGWVNHGWLELPDGDIIDPTRWVFEDARPYVYMGPNDDCYDNEGNRTWSQMKRRPFPTVEDGEALLSWVDLPEAVIPTLARVTGQEITYPVKLSQDQWFWLGNVPPAVHGADAFQIIQAFEKTDHRGLVPRGFRNIVFNLDSQGKRIAV